MAKKQPTTARQWAARIARWQHSGLTSEEFGRREGFRGDQLSWWKWHLSKRAKTETRAQRRRGGTTAKPVASQPVAFVEARLAASAVPALPASNVEIVLRNGRVARVPQGCDRAWLAQVLTAAERVD
jgi:hypothetical protein